MTTHRRIKDSIIAQINSNKVIVIFGARRVGKTFLINEIAEEFTGNHLLLNGENLDVKDLISQRRVSSYDQWAKNLNLLLIDEAQAIPDIGKALKLLIDSYPKLTIIATGSSAFDLSNQTGEPLVGRQIVFRLFPFAQLELQEKENILETKSNLQDRLIYGSYPDVVTSQFAEDKRAYLIDLVNSFLLKDILIYEQVKNADKMLNLLKLIAFQVGSEVSYNELGNTLQLDRNTVERYLDLFSKVFIIFKVGGYSNNLRKEVSKSTKWYFYDNGLRNALIDDFKPITARQDIGSLWENYIISERLKRDSYLKKIKQYYFWRTYDQQEIDWIEVENTKISAFEMKWKESKVSAPKAFAKAYPEAGFIVINQESYRDFII
jgi:predicted AAA+ superfamily ATPase